MENFFEKLADVLDVEEIKGTDVLEDFEEWDSLSILTIISYVGSTYKKMLTANEIRAAKTAEELYHLVSA